MPNRPSYGRLIAEFSQAVDFEPHLRITSQRRSETMGKCFLEQPKRGKPQKGKEADNVGDCRDKHTRCNGWVLPKSLQR